MLVLLVVALILSTVNIGFFSDDTKKRAEDEVKRLQVVFSMASDYAVLNQYELGLRLDEEKRTYEFVKLDDDDQWVPIEDTSTYFNKYELPSNFEMTLNLDGLPWLSEDSLFDDEFFSEELSVSNDSVEIGEEEDKPPPPPQIFILSSGEFTPFELTLRYIPKDFDALSYTFSLQGIETVPLKREEVL